LADGPALPTMNLVSSRLPTIRRETILTFAVFDGGVEVWEYDNRGVASHWIAVPLNELRQLSLRFRNSCRDPGSDLRNLRRDGHLLYDLLIAPVEKTLSTGRRLVIETDDVLSELPFEALLDKQNHYLVDRFPVVDTFGLYYDEVLRRNTLLSRDSPILIASVPSPRMNLGGVLPVLPDAEKEAITVAALFQQSSLLLGDESTLHEVLGRLPRASIFHFAGHALASSSHAGILLSDGMLETSAVRPEVFSNLELAVLSACETDRGTSESARDTDGFVRFLVRARVPHVLASRWRVDSVATSSLIQAFYSTLLTGRSVSEALQAAEIELKRQPGFQHPYFWSSFRAFGRA
jgi:CHAT domain-containing protein